jgi:hypothetical protein
MGIKFSIKKSELIELLNSIPDDPEIYIGDPNGIKPINLIGKLRTTREGWHTNNRNAQSINVSIMSDTRYHDINIVETLYGNKMENDS